MQVVNRSAGTGVRAIVAAAVIAVVLRTVAAAHGAEDSGDDGPPNIVVILADDLGYGDPGCYNDESRIPTPRIDALAAAGIRFTDAHTPSSVCTPTRYGLLTGRYCWRTALQRSVLWPWDPPLLEPRRLTLPEVLQRAGYHTACIGKWHLGWDWPLRDGGFVTDELEGHTIPRPQRAAWGARVDFGRATRGGPVDHGFDAYFGDDVPNFPPYCFLENDRVVSPPTVQKPDGMFGHPGPALAGWDLSAVLPTLAQRAVRYIEQRATQSGRPFFLYLPLTAPHTPIAPSPHFIGRSEAGWYGDFVHEVDWVVGQVLDALERTGLAGTTLGIFTSDNGSPQRDGTAMSGPIGSVPARFGHDPSRPWRGMKSDA
ncbi:MAG: sulfatase family protein, partial [Planctomycetota bacterium]